MKNLLIVTTLIFSSAAIFGQEAKVKTDKEKYKFDEVIEVTFELNAKYDSISLPEFEGFKLINGPTKSSSYSVNNGKETIVESRMYELRPLQSGRLNIYSPTYFIDGKTIKGEPVEINVDPSNLSAKELEEKATQEFIEDRIKPKGTTRIIIHDNKGYLEVFGETEWEFHRRLTTKEIKRIKKIK